MASAEMLGKVVAAITAVLGPDAPVEAIRISRRPDGVVRVDLTTSVPGRLIGRRGATADALRARIADELGVAVELNIQQARPQDPPLDPPAGVREPRRPHPGAPPTGAALDPPHDIEHPGRPAHPEDVDPPLPPRLIPGPRPERPTETPRPHRRGAA